MVELEEDYRELEGVVNDSEGILQGCVRPDLLEDPKNGIAGHCTRLKSGLSYPKGGQGALLAI